jgi:di/tricarboxylate transporter
VLDQTILFAVLAAAAVLFVWGRWRYDVVAVMALLTLAVTGVVAPAATFVGFGHPAVITVAAVLVISRGLENAGVVDLFTRAVLAAGQRPVIQLAVLTGLAALLSAFMNNTGALALLMPVAVQMSRRFDLPPSRILMPLAFASLLGGMVTLIGTPSNIIISTLRREAVGSGFAMFDFAPVGAGVAALGLVVLAIAARLVPQRDGQVTQEDLFDLAAYTTEVSVPEGSRADGKTLFELMKSAGDAVVAVIIRGERRISAPARTEVVEAGDLLIVEGDTETLEKLVRREGLILTGVETGKSIQELASGDVRLLEVVVRPGSDLEARSAREVHLRRYYQVNLLAVAREGQRIIERLGRMRFRAGDVLLLQGELPALQRTMRLLGCLPLAERDIHLPRPRRIVLSLGFFVGAVAAAGAGLLPIETAFACAALLLILSRIVGLQQAYEALDLPVLVLLGAMLPVGHALETTGGAQLLAEGLLGAGQALPDWTTLFILIFATALLSSLMNNAAVAVVMAPVAIAIAGGLGAAADPFLMAVAIGAAAAFLTPIGHQCNALVMGPGGYRFGDYWRLGLPLTLVIATAAVPLILWFWPLR